MAKPLHIFTPSWHPHFNNLFVNALGRSLKWPANAEAVRDSIWTICTDTQSSADSLELAAHTIIPSCKVRIQLQPRFSEPNSPIGALKMKCLLKSIRECLNEATPMLMSTPDFIWADGSIGNMVDESYPDEGQGLCVSIAHMRVLPTLLLDFQAKSPAQLVQQGLDFAHDSWTRCEIGLDPSGIYHAGLSWRRVKNAISVQHQMPSPFLVNFRECDLEEFSRWKGMTPPAFGEWDHDWPSRLIEQGRLRYLGSSDLAFMVEVTEADKNVPPLEPARTPHDQFFRTEPSVKIQKQFISTFRY